MAVEVDRLFAVELRHAAASTDPSVAFEHFRTGAAQEHPISLSWQATGGWGGDGGSTNGGGGVCTTGGLGGGGSNEGGGDSHPGELHCAPHDGVDPDLYCTLGTEICGMEANAQWPFVNHCVPVPDVCSSSSDGTCDCDEFTSLTADGSEVGCGVFSVDCRQDVNAITVTCDGQSKASPRRAVTLAGCEPDQTPFSDACGCGCIDRDRRWGHACQER
ncbi:hypothetical protein [Sorangium sp. So ce1182]|uniref:hypothetical protein n=1 Tax=Sorangium sp. So ce1182 TaxID=3133334 RepID=UPI003F6419AC